jgi:hypothetical protein
MKTYEVYSSQKVLYVKEVKAKNESVARDMILSEAYDKGKIYDTTNFEVYAVKEKRKE